MANMMATFDQLCELAARIVQVEATLNDERAAAVAAATATTATGGQGSFVRNDAKWRDGGLENTSLTTLLPHAEAADPVVLSSSLQGDGTVLAASLGLHHLLFHLTTRPALDKVVTSGDGEGLHAWNSLVARWDRELGSRSAGILLELMRVDFSGDLLSKMEEYERPCSPSRT